MASVEYYRMWGVTVCGVHKGGFIQNIEEGFI